jgi:putative intracellular protease/amidase
MAHSKKYFKLNAKDSPLETVKTVNRYISHGATVFRWQGSETSFAEPGDLILCSTTSQGLPTSELAELPESELIHLAPLKPGRVALLWDKSFLWGYLASVSLRDLGFSFDLLTAEEVRNGALDGFQLLVVPGGWASLKSEELQVAGRDRLRRFVRNGGSYLGLCGGAGLALQVDEGLSMLPVARKPMAQRLPNFSGSIRIRRTSTHSLWWGLQGEVSLQVWWPSQFELVDSTSVQVLGRYGLPAKDFCVSDLNVGDTEAADLDWESLEREYQINRVP